ncbi:MAG: hypothetical protein HY063_13960 [Bacteroidetes bacterium]|nr:hypothetical protein [Bacteroidota bacterium]
MLTPEQFKEMKMYFRMVEETYKKAKKIKGITPKEYEKLLRENNIPERYIKGEMEMTHPPATFRAARIKKGLSVNQLTKKSKVNISRLENSLSIKHYGIKSIVRVSHALDLTLDIAFVPHSEKQESPPLRKIKD